MSERSPPDDDTTEEWPEPNPSPHLTPFRTTGEIVEEVFYFPATGLAASAGVIVTIKIYHVAAGEPITLAFSNGVIAFVLVLIVGFVLRYIRGVKS